MKGSRACAAPWTVVHGFYAGMGGFIFPASILETNQSTAIFKSGCQRLTLTARGVALLADCDLLPDIERKYLDDKSKSDGLSKFIACVQAAWLIVQVIGRLTKSLQISLLEINTLGHVLCALIIYVLWWHKPRMVMEPTALQGDWAISICAYMYMSSRISGQMTEQTSIKSEISSLAYFPEQCAVIPLLVSKIAATAAPFDQPTKSRSLHQLQSLSQARPATNRYPQLVVSLVAPLGYCRNHQPLQGIIAKLEIGIMTTRRKAQAKGVNYAGVWPLKRYEDILPSGDASNPVPTKMRVERIMITCKKSSPRSW